MLEKPSRLISKSKLEKAAAEASRIVSKPKDAESEPSRLKGKSLEKKRENTLEKGAVLINTGMETDKDPEWAAKAEFTIIDTQFQEGRGTVYILKSEGLRAVVVKSEKVLQEEIERGKYRFKE